MEELDKISKEIDDYNLTVQADADFVGRLQGLLETARARKAAEPKSEQTRHWAVVYTQLESTIAYVKTYLGGPSG